MIIAELRPRGPYSLRLSTRFGSDATRSVRDGVLTMTLATEAGLEQASVLQRPDGTVSIQAASEATLARLRFVLGLDDDHSSSSASSRPTRCSAGRSAELRGLRPLRTRRSRTRCCAPSQAS